MRPKQHKCALCTQESKYRCSACPVRYCSVACYKTHKLTCVKQGGEEPAPSLEPPSGVVDASDQAQEPESQQVEEAEAEQPLRALTTLKWPPEPDAAIFMDPLKRDDPKPLRHSELERVATSKPLRSLLAEPRLASVLRALDGQPTQMRHASLARILGVDSESLAKPAASALMDRGSPPPLQDLLAGEDGARERDDWGTQGWWLGTGEGRVWIGEEERQLVRLWAGVTVQAIDGGDGDWGQGELEWQVGS